MKYNFLKTTFIYWQIKAIRDFLIRIKHKDIFRQKCKIICHGSMNVNKCIIGGGNEIFIGQGSMLNHVKVRIVGNGNSIKIGNNCYIGKGCSIWLEGNNVTVTIGDRCTFTHDTQLCAQEDNSQISIGADCMFSHHINVRTSDSHLIYDIQTGKRMNYAKNVSIGEHVWIAPEAKIMKGCTIGDGAIIGSNAVVTKDVPRKSLAVGIPAKVVKENVSWKRDKLF